MRLKRRVDEVTDGDQPDKVLLKNAPDAREGLFRGSEGGGIRDELTLHALTHGRSARKTAWRGEVKPHRSS